MPETLPVIGLLQQAVPSDVEFGFREARASTSNVVRDAVEPGLAFEGFNMAANPGDTQIQVGTGRFYKYGEIYGRYENQILDLLNALPSFDQQYLAICVGGRVAYKIDGRAFLRSTERNPDGSRNVYQKDTQTQEIYLAELSIVPGEIAVTPKMPTDVGNDRVVIAYALVSREGLVSITVAADNRVSNVRRLRVEQRLVGGARLLEHGAARVVQPILREVADGEGGWRDDVAAVGLFQPGEHLEQRGLAGPVGSAQANAVAVTNLPGDVVEQRAIAEGLGKVRELDHV